MALIMGIIVIAFLAWAIWQGLQLFWMYVIYKGVDAHDKHKKKKMLENDYNQQTNYSPTPRLAPDYNNPFKDIIPHLNSATNAHVSQIIEYLGEPASFEEFNNGREGTFYRGTWLKSGYMLSLIFDINKRYMYIEKTQ